MVFSGVFRSRGSDHWRHGSHANRKEQAGDLWKDGVRSRRNAVMERSGISKYPLGGCRVRKPARMLHSKHSPC